MNCFVQYSKIKHINSFQNIVKISRHLSTQAQTIHQELVNQEDSNKLYTRVITKKPQRQPFMKNVFLGDFDSEILGFPEALNNEELNNLNTKVSVITNFLSELNTSGIINATLSTDIRNQLNELQLFGLQAPKQAGGLELSVTENCRVLEAVSKCRSLATSIISHQYLGVQAVINNGNETIINKYLSQLSSGKSIAAFCLLEEDNSDLMLMKTHTKRSADGTTFILNGNKSWVVNGSQGDVYVVLACTEEDSSATTQDRMSVLLVEKTFGGITTSPCQPMGLKGADICNVSFKDTPVPIGNILGEGGDCTKVLMPLLSGLRLSTGPSCISILQELVSKFAESTLQTRHGTKYLSDTDFIQDIIAKINLDLYAIESMTYVTAGLLDKYEKQDCDLESTIIKVFSSEKCLESVQQCMKLVGPAAYIEGHWLNSLYNDALGHVILNETNASLRMVISLLGLQHAGSGLNTSVKKLRNPFFFPGYIVKKMWDRRRQDADNPKLNMQLENYLHPSLIHSSRWLEYCVYRLQYATETMLVRHGPEIVQQHMELRRLADVAIDIYAMASVLSRSSRSYCIGLQNADYEILLANAFCLNARDRVKSIVMEISNGPYGTNDVNYQKIAGRAFKFNGYFAEHTLKKNF